MVSTAWATASRHVNSHRHCQSARDRHHYAARDHHTARQRSTTGRPKPACDAPAAGYRYETFLVVTTNTEAAAMLNDPQARKYGLRELPPGTERLGTAIVVTRE
jgi:hypothetical protein